MNKLRGLIRLASGLALPALAVSLVPIASAHAVDAAAPDAELLTLHEGTNINVAASPDQQTLALLLRGGIFILPTKGGEARRIVDHDYKAQAPVWTADGKEVIFSSNHDGTPHIFAADVASGKVRLIIGGPNQATQPSVAAKGDTLLCLASSPLGLQEIRETNLKSGQSKPLPIEAGATDPTYAANGDIVYYLPGKDGSTAIKRRAADGIVIPLYTASGRVGPPAVSPNGQHILYATVVEDGARLYLDGKLVSDNEDVFLRRAQWLGDTSYLYTADGEIKRRDIGGAPTMIPFSAGLEIVKSAYERKKRDYSGTAPNRVLGITRPTEAPNGEISFAALGDLWSTRPDAQPHKLTDDVAADRDATWSPDGKWLLYSSDRAGDYDLWLRGPDGQERRLTTMPGAEIRASWSPDGKSVVFIHTREQPTDGQIWTVNVVDGQAKQLVDYNYGPGYPVFSGDGANIVFPRFDGDILAGSGGFNQLYTISAGGGEAKRINLFPLHSVTKRTADGPAISPDGRWLAFEMKEPVSSDGLLDGPDAIWLQPLAPSGQPDGEARKLINVSPEYLSWSRDGKSLLFLNVDRLQRIDIASGKTSDVPIELSWTNAIPAGRLVVHAGRLIDGVHDTPRNDVDIIVDGNRITGVEPHQDGRKADRFVDASKQTVMPGLIEMHYHLMLDQFGRHLDQAYLSYGVTTIRTPGAWPYEMLAQRETLASGRRPGPRVVGTGYIFEGSHFFAHDPTVVAMTDAAIATEIERAKRLDYDWIKTYDLYPAHLERKVVAAAHAAGLPVTGHELYPAAAFGKDGVEHLDFGYDDKVSPMGIAYDDVLQIMRASQIAVTPTVGEIYSVLDTAPNTYEEPRWKSLLKPFWDDSKPGDGVSWGAQLHSARAKNILASLKKMRDAGVFLLAGSDSPYVQTPFGITTHSQIETYVQAGFRPVEALRAATLNNARALNIDAGSIEVGKLADIVVVDGDPLSDIHAARNVVTTIANGTVYSQAQLLDLSNHK